ncbi:hypothetical protein J6590_074461 [Homalodisca vitripennis]|nr:hypothetical protein J6590_074461 [Homalodisca vitripennis]
MKDFRLLFLLTDSRIFRKQNSVVRGYFRLIVQQRVNECANVTHVQRQHGQSLQVATRCRRGGGIWPDQASDVTAPLSHHSACRDGTALRSKKWLSP